MWKNEWNSSKKKATVWCEITKIPLSHESVHEWYIKKDVNLSFSFSFFFSNFFFAVFLLFPPHEGILFETFVNCDIRYGHLSQSQLRFWTLVPYVIEILVISNGYLWAARHQVACYRSLYQPNWPLQIYPLFTIIYKESILLQLIIFVGILIWQRFW